MAGLEVLILHDVGDVVDGGRRQPFGLEEPDDFLARALADGLRDGLVDRLAIGDTRVVRREARIGEQVPEAEGLEHGIR